MRVHHPTVGLLTGGHSIVLNVASRASRDARVTKTAGMKGQRSAVGGCGRARRSFLSALTIAVPNVTTPAIKARATGSLMRAEYRPGAPEA